MFASGESSRGEYSDVRRLSLVLSRTCSCEDLTGQNAVLHEHLESFSTRAAKIQAQQAPDADGDLAGEAASANAEHDDSVEQLRQVIKYLRGEKDIVDFQLELAKQETARLRTQLEFTTRNLEEARQALTEVNSAASIYMLLCLTLLFRITGAIEEWRDQCILSTACRASGAHSHRQAPAREQSDSQG